MEEGKSEDPTLGKFKAWTCGGWSEQGHLFCKILSGWPLQLSSWPSFWTPSPRGQKEDHY